MAANRPPLSEPAPEPESVPVGVWPSAVWIAVGTLYYLGNPDRFAGWKGAIFFVFGTGVVALVGGIAGAAVHRRANRILDRLLDEVFQQRTLTTRAIALAVHLMVGLMEGVAAAGLAGWIIDLLG